MSHTGKKLLSTVLCVCLCLSALIPGLTVFAADKSEALLALEAEIAAFEGKTDIADLDEEIGAAYNALISGYAALSASEKEAMDILIFDKLYNMVLKHEAAVYKKENPTSKLVDQYKNGNAVARTLLSPPAYVVNGLTLSEIINDSTKTAQQKLDAFAAADENTRMFVGAYYNSYKDYYYAIGTYPTTAIEKIVAAFADEGIKATPNPDPKPGRMTKPNVKNYPLGDADPAYIADMQTYFSMEETYFKWYTANETYRIQFELEALQKIVNVAPEYKLFRDTTLSLLNAKRVYDEGGDAKTLAAQAVAEYDALSALDQLRIQKYTKTVYSLPVFKSTFWTYENKRPSHLYTSCVDIGNEQLLFDFVAVINSIEEPYVRAHIEAAKEAYAKVPASLIATIPADTLQKYKDILASITPDIPSDILPDLTNKPHTEVSYPMGISKSNVTATYESLANVLFDGLGLDVAELISGNVYTNAMVGTLVKAIYPALGELSSLVLKGPAALASALTEEKFAGAKAALDAAVSEYNDKGAAIENLADWQNVEFQDGDWGFTDGDREGFLDAAAASFRALSILTMAITFENKISTSAGTYTYGAYEDLIPVFEALGLRGVTPSTEYTESVDAAVSSSLKMDARIRTILVPVANLLDDLSADPLNTLLDLLPRFAMLLNEDILNTQINKILSEMKFVTIDPVDLSTTGLFNMIAPKLESIEVKAAETDEEGNEITPATTIAISLDEERFVKLIADLAGCGTYTAHPSVARTSSHIACIDADRTDTFVVLFEYLRSELITKKNTNAVLNAIYAQELPFFTHFAITLLISVVQKAPSAMIWHVMGMALPLARMLISFSKLFSFTSQS